MRSYFALSGTAIVLLTQLSANGVFGAEGLILFTEAEAQRLRLPKDETPRVMRTRSLARGPRVDVRLPKVEMMKSVKTIHASSPTNLFVVFEQFKAPVDMDSLEIRARQGLFSKSLISLLKPYIHETAILVDQLEIPEGRYQIEIEIADQAGEKTAETYLLEVIR